MMDRCISRCNVLTWSGLVVYKRSAAVVVGCSEFSLAVAEMGIMTSERDGSNVFLFVLRALGGGRPPRLWDYFLNMFIRWTIITACKP